jgi:Protein of unknown function (DUF4197)
MKTSKVLIFSIAILFLGCTAAQISQTAGMLDNALVKKDSTSTQDVISGLKEALVQGVSKGSDQASQLDGYFNNSLLKILMPPDMQKVDQKMRAMGFNKLMDDFELSMNRGAEDAAKQAKPIFVNAITSMSISDAWNILKGQNDAATTYLKTTTNTQLYNAFKPVIQTSLDKVDATKHYTQIITTYNKIPLVQKVNPDLNDYVTNKAIDGLFILVKNEEANIRTNPAARATDLLKKVFTPENMKK